MNIEKVKSEIQVTTDKYKKSFSLNYFMTKKLMEKVDLDFDKIINNNTIFFPNITQKRNALRKLAIFQCVPFAATGPICYAAVPYKYAKLQGQYIEELISQ